MPTTTRSQTARHPRPAALAVALILAITGRAAGEGGEPAPTPSLEARLIPLIKPQKGRVPLAVKDLPPGESFESRADEPMPTASLIKFPVMVEAYRQAEAK